MDLYIVRHGKAEERTPNKGDANRRLVDAGIRDMRAISKAMAVLKIRPDIIVSSPLKRARQTAEILSGVLKPKKSIVWDELKPEASPHDTLKKLKSADFATSVILVGHEPHLSSLVSIITAGSAISILLKKGGLVHIEIYSMTRKPHGALRGLLTPKQMKKIC